MKHIITAIAVALLGAGCHTGSEKAPAKPVASTAQPSVSLLSGELAMPGLDRKRQIRLYLPPDYATSGKRYPVLYMHDGQNLFDASTAYAGEWNIDEAMNALAKEGKLELIVVGVDNGGAKRMTELNPWDNAEFGKGEGEKYMDFVVKTVKPLIDASYRTLPDRANTAVMGSSMGGLISHYAINQYPDVFSKAGIFSPAYWVGMDAFKLVGAKPARADARLYLLMGGDEGRSMVNNVQLMATELKKTGHPEANTVLKIVQGGKHNEAFWSGEFRQAILWMFEKPAAVAAR